MIPEVQPVKIHYGNNEATQFDFEFYVDDNATDEEIEEMVEDLMKERKSSFQNSILKTEKLIEMPDEMLLDDIANDYNSWTTHNMCAIKESSLADVMGLQSQELAHHSWTGFPSEKESLHLDSRVLKVISEMPEEEYQREILQAVQEASDSIRKKYKTAKVKDGFAHAGAAVTGIGMFPSIATALTGVPGSIVQLVNEGAVQPDWAILGVLGVAGLAGCISYIKEYGKNEKNRGRTLSDFVEDFLVEKLQELGYIEKERDNYGKVVRKQSAMNQAVPQM